MTILSLRKCTCVRLTNFKLLNKVKRKSVSDCNFLKYVIFVTGIVTRFGLRKTWLPQWLQPLPKKLNFLGDRFYRKIKSLLITKLVVLVTYNLDIYVYELYACTK
jgi:hypothetical protein